MNIYIHTLNGMPAMFDGDQVCYATIGQKQHPALSLRQIRKEQRVSIAYRWMNFREKASESVYSYRRYVL